MNEKFVTSCSNCTEQYDLMQCSRDRLPQQNVLFAVTMLTNVFKVNLLLFIGISKRLSKVLLAKLLLILETCLFIKTNFKTVDAT